MAHEPFDRREEDTRRPTERSFGITFAVIFTIIGLIRLIHDGEVRWWALGVGALFLAAAYLYPAVLGPLNQLWFKFGLLLHRIVNPLVLGIMFLLFITPMAVAMRLFGKRFLNVGFDATAKSYWNPRNPPGPDPETIRNQF
jgi:hypothetical protein